MHGDNGLEGKYERSAKQGFSMAVSTKSAVTAADAKAGHIVVPSAAAGSIVLRGVRVTLDTDVGLAFIEDCARHTDGLLSDSDIKSKWCLSDETWAGLAANTKLLHAVRAARERRVLNGDAAREAAQRFVVKAPSVLRDILGDETVSPRHRIEAARELHRVAGSGNTPDKRDKEKFVVVINLGAGEKPFRYETEIEHRAGPLLDDGEQQ
jgi:hypothetical protein